MQTFRRLTGLLLTLLAWTTQAQVVTTQPVFFSETTPVTITFDASQGNSALRDFTGPVYIWTGTVTNLSANNTTWRNVKSPTFNQADPAALMTRDATNPNLYRITFTPRTFYPVPANETILRLGMIFKNADGSIVGRATDGGDIFIDVYQGGAAVRITNPARSTNPQFVAPNVALPVAGESAQAANLVLTLNGTQIAQATNATTISGSATPTLAGRNVLKLTAGTGATAVSDSVILIVRPTVTVAALPAGAQEGITYLPGGTSVILALTAPNKQFVYAVGQFNNFQADASGFMNKTPDNNMWWVQLNGLTPGQEYAYQYLIDGTIRVADPFTEKVLDPNNDRFIPAVTYPGLTYPAGQTGIMSTFQTNQTAYQWQTNNFTRPAKADLVIYELHLRDFIERHDFQTLRDTLNYIQRLGINCIELMPVNEFEGNDSWGYNPSFYFAVDKYYGTKNAFKAFIDEAHRRGIAVVIDMVLNHSFGQSPMVQMYSNGGEPTADNPWFNRVARHPFNVGYDMNHESPFTRAFSKKVMDFWVNEFRVDGYRFDLSKGFTQVNTGNDVGAWGRYDQSRINIWNDYNTHMQNTRSGTYVMLEHFAENSEELVLSNAGMMLWGNMHGAYANAIKGATGSSNFAGAYHVDRGWQQPNLISYMESHDEPRLVYEALTAGLSNTSGYNVRNLPTALSRMEMSAAFFLPIPGPKLIWQFGEFGYDIDINLNGRTGAKPILWIPYLQDANRRRVRDTYTNLIALRKLPGYNNAAFTYQLGGQSKSMHLTSPTLNVTIVGNFGVFGDQINPQFQQAGKWYNYLTGDSITVANPNALLTLNAGDYAVYTNTRIRRVALATRGSQQQNTFRLSAAPNPASNSTTVRYELPVAGTVQLSVRNVLGQTVLTLPAVKQAAGSRSQELPLGKLAPGVYLVHLRADSRQQVLRLVVE
ncbi:alpha-amylase family glycosyl hydrolase [Hymenobacter arizonensis]|uniref:Por secretion system C-terminal sorting domain-containing protein n=1 Tax=Hymenobacter arizonensis TaxID=1227077 RepID=A0A1I5USA2_HYMAR|nr:alpha-amylase family glycosyl hydrolase [Hymenobacter arizonensis]SFP97616.1 Por secretion system C-terminal sorting domain-containing protein [Hymenobacter arizonensis]